MTVTTTSAKNRARLRSGREGTDTFRREGKDCLSGGYTIYFDARNCRVIALCWKRIVAWKNGEREYRLSLARLAGEDGPLSGEKKEKTRWMSPKLPESGNPTQALGSSEREKATV